MIRLFANQHFDPIHRRSGEALWQLADSGGPFREISQWSIFTIGVTISLRRPFGTLSCVASGLSSFSISWPLACWSTRQHSCKL
jgi:hypothetical protein